MVFISLILEGEQVNDEYIHRVRKVTFEVQKWVDKTLHTPVDLQEYIAVNLEGK